MNIYEEIRSKLTEEWKGGATQQEIADRAGVTNQHINNLISGKRSVESMKLETLFKLFPQAEINLSGAQLAGDHAVQIQGGVSLSADNVRSKILNTEILSSDEKIKVLKVLES
nr:MAG TPA: Transcriptional regulator [Caudoviricetes sp.]